MRTPLVLVALASLVVALSGCELMKRNEDALAVIHKRVLGMPAGEFFDRYGRPRQRSEIAGGTIEYDWISAVGYARPGPEGLDEHLCRLRLTSDARGRISRAEVLYDAPGLRGGSRCGEIFAAP